MAKKKGPAKRYTETASEDPVEDGPAEAPGVVAGASGAEAPARRVGKNPAQMVGRLDAVLRGLGLPVSGVAYHPSGETPGAIVRLAEGATAAQQQLADTVAAGFDWSDEAEAAWQNALGN